MRLLGRKLPLRCTAVQLPWLYTRPHRDDGEKSKLVGGVGVRTRKVPTQVGRRSSAATALCPRSACDSQEPAHRDDATGGFASHKRAARVMTETALPHGWKPDPDGTGIVRIPEGECPPVPRPGSESLVESEREDLPRSPHTAPFSSTPPLTDCSRTVWAKIDGLEQDTTKNGWFVEVLSEEPEDGVIKIKSEEEMFMIKPNNLVELPGSEKTPRCVRALLTLTPNQECTLLVARVLCFDIILGSPRPCRCPPPLTHCPHSPPPAADECCRFLIKEDAK